MTKYVIHYAVDTTGSGYAAAVVTGKSPEEALDNWTPPDDGKDREPMAWSVYAPSLSNKTQRLEAMKFGRLIINGVVQHPNTPAPAPKPAGPDLNAAMIKRDGPAKQATPVRPVPAELAQPTSKPYPFAKFISPDLVPNTHQVNPAYGTCQ